MRVWPPKANATSKKDVIQIDYSTKSSRWLIHSVNILSKSCVIISAVSKATGKDVQD